MNNNETDLIVRSGPADLQISRSMDQVLDEAGIVAKTLMRMVDKTKAFVVFGGNKYLEFEAWQCVAQCFRVTTTIREDRFVQFGEVCGWEATADVIHLASGNIIGSATSMCLNDEENWGVRPKYEWRDGKRVKVGEEKVPLFQLRSMAQTRAQAKALRSKFSWVVTLAGYAPTAAEEMTGHDPGAQQGKPAMQEPGAKTANAEGKPLISDAQGKRFYALLKSNGWTDEDGKKLLAAYGFGNSKEITKEKYELVCSLQWPAQTVEAGGSGGSAA